ncbi:MAG: lactoylglutathione lyase [Blastocatellia bacterium]|jgi:catechol 2,3-dioxygenase-like lactoylglutathione lyase family enzyme|nr:lactoylglutathione lyase [Blastocatellia bacterium]
MKSEVAGPVYNTIPNHEDNKMKAVFLYAAPYADDALNLPVESIDAAVPYYEKIFGFHFVSRQDKPFRSVILGRDGIQIGLAENGGDPTQEGCFFEVDDVKAAFNEIKGAPPSDSDFRLDKFGEVTYQVFFEIAPDGLCYMLGERQG